MLIYVAADAAAHLETVRSMLDGARCAAGASAWNGLMVVRAIARDGHALQSDVAPILRVLAGRPVPRLWQC
jgi:urease accessory protein